MTAPNVAPAPEHVVCEVGPAYDEHGVLLAPVRDLTCGICGEHSLRAPSHNRAPVEQWAATHARHTGHQDFTATTIRRLRAVPVAYEPEATTW
jgi:hypothetical protein